MPLQLNYHFFYTLGLRSKLFGSLVKLAM
uniref:Uncharacterized protein n=1 Tax=Rhizophora mucronata TaxID=61149 RepID=A0A2P2PFJ0_RHIMU